MEKVTKPKNPGRVAQGHKLAAWNKQRKADMLKEQSPSTAAEPPSTAAPAEAPSTAAAAAAAIPVSVFFVVGLIGGVYYWHTKTPALPAAPVAPVAPAAPAVPAAPAAPVAPKEFLMM